MTNRSEIEALADRADALWKRTGNDDAYYIAYELRMLAEHGHTAIGGYPGNYMPPDSAELERMADTIGAMRVNGFDDQTAIWVVLRIRELARRLQPARASEGWVPPPIPTGADPGPVVSRDGSGWEIYAHNGCGYTADDMAEYGKACAESLLALLSAAPAPEATTPLLPCPICGGEAIHAREVMEQTVFMRKPVPHHVAMLDKKGDEVLCHDVPKFSRELADGHYRLYAYPRPAPPPAEPGDQLGMTECGKPLCTSEDHHPLCSRAAEKPGDGGREGVEATLRRAADMLDGFEKALVRYAPIDDIEEWPYHPEITEMAETLRRLASDPQPIAPGEFGQKFIDGMGWVIPMRNAIKYATYIAKGAADELSAQPEDSP